MDLAVAANTSFFFSLPFFFFNGMIDHLTPYITAFAVDLNIHFKIYLIIINIIIDAIELNLSLVQSQSHKEPEFKKSRN